MIQAIKRATLRKIINLAATASDENLIRAVKLGKRFLIRDPDTKRQADAIIEAFKSKHPAIQLVKEAFRRASPNVKKKMVENFFVNAGIIGVKQKRKLEKKLGFRLPFFFVISPSAKCNLKCVGCYASEYSMDETLPYEEVDRILTEAKQLGIYFITISGGEPFVYPGILDLFKKHNDMEFQVYTNGTLINKELARKLAELGNVAPAISVEGLEKETDLRRGKGVFKKVMEAMDNLKEAGVIFGFSATPTKKNSEVIMSDEFFDLMIAKGASFGWFFQYIPIGRKPDVSLMSTPEQRNKLRLKVNEVRNTKPIFLGDFWNDGQFVGGCMAGARPGGYFHINCQGNVEPCVFFQFSVDNIKGKKLVDVIQSPFFKAIQEAQPYCDNKNLLTPCAIIDNPEVSRFLVEKYGAKPSYNGSYDIVRDKNVKKHLDDYSKKMKKMTDSLWENDISKHHKHWKDKK
ncbi:MAG: radical SAM protein [Candidatus Pacearchaeota archaeon]|jgi:MoaA/NifB/PqqE/SkfB family radical SAM enzyme